MSARTTAQRVLLTALMFALALLAGCGGGAAFEANDYLMTWMMSRPTGEVVSELAGRTGDKQVDAVLTAASVVNDIRLADESYEQAKEMLGKSQPDMAADLLDEAIQLRPDDARYRRDRALLAIQAYNAQAAQQQWSEQDRIARANGWFDTTTYWLDTELDAVDEQERLEAQSPGPERDRALAAVYTRLSDVYLNWSESLPMRATSVGRRDLRDKADEFAAKADALAP